MIMRSTLIKKINNADWWHVTPSDPEAYEKRGKFFASTFTQAEFYGRPNDIPERVSIKNPVFGFSEREILIKLFNKENARKYLAVLSDDNNTHDPDWYKKRINLDARIHNRARELGHDAIVLMGSAGKKALLRRRKPNSIELNVIDLSKNIKSKLI